VSLGAPGSALWLLRHDLRLAGREFRSGGRRQVRAARYVMGAAILLLHLFGFLAAPILARVHDDDRGTALLTLSVALAGAFALFLSKAVSEATDALFQRGDLDLLLSSPLPTRRVLFVRLVAVAVTAGFLPLLLVVPLVNGMVVRGYFAWAGLYAVQASLSLLAAALGAALTFGLHALLGPRWTRIATRTLATLFGALTFFIIYAHSLLPAHLRAAIWAAWAPLPGAVPPGLQWWPARALLGDPLPLAALAVLAVAAAVGVSTMLGRAYAAGVMGTLASPAPARAAGAERHFRDGVFAAVLRKERRLLLRHPGMLAQLVYQFVFLVPGALALMNISGRGPHSGAGVVFLTAMMTGRITKVIVAGPFESDQAPALAAASPLPPRLATAAKIIVTVTALALVGGLPVLGIGVVLPLAFPAACLACGAAAATRLGLAIARPRSMRRDGLHGRLRASTDGLLGAAVDIGWGAFGAVLTATL